VKFPWKKIVILIGILAVAASLKVWLVAMGRVPFNADEAVVALMSRHILMAGERPVFFYGQAYMGSLDAYLVAAGFLIFGQQVWVIRLVQGLLYLGTIITTVWIGQAAFGSLKTGILATCLLAIPAVNVTLYTTASLGGYGEALLIGNLILLAGVYAVHSLADGQTKTKYFMTGLGLLVGLGLWANGLTLVYSIPACLVVFFAHSQHRKTIGVKDLLLNGSGLALGFLAGSSPWWIYAIGSGWGSLFGELFGSAISVEPGGLLSRLGAHLLNLVVLGGTALFGLRPPWEVRWLALPLLPLALIFWLGVLGFLVRNMLRNNPRRLVYWLLGGVGLVFAAGFLLTSFGVDPSGRYFLPLTVPLALAAAEMVQALPRLRKTTWQVLCIAVVLVFNLWGTLQSAVYPPGITTQFYAPSAIDHRYDAQLLNFLDQAGEHFGYSNYWVAYPLAFQSQERTIFIPRLPYHPDLRFTTRDDRYQPYDRVVADSQQVAYITTRNPALDVWLRNGFSQAGVSWSEKTIGDYQVFYHLSRPVRPEQIGLGDNR
jgi:4-amino-4-deoxy-L-arabinose transferase-like glycosyltransferase